jgi:hypothetical protein
LVHAGFYGINVILGVSPAGEANTDNLYAGPIIVEES